MTPDDFRYIARAIVPGEWTDNKRDRSPKDFVGISDDEVLALYHALSEQDQHYACLCMLSMKESERQFLKDQLKKNVIKAER